MQYICNKYLILTERVSVEGALLHILEKYV